MFTFLTDTYDTVGGAGMTAFMVFFLYVWLLWAVKTVAASRYKPWQGPALSLTTTVIVPVFNEPEAVFRRSLASVVANRPTEIIVVVDGAAADVAAVASDYADRVLRIPKAGKRAACAGGSRTASGDALTT